MHSFDAGNNYIFHFNGDYSGDIIITHPDKDEYEIDAEAFIKFSRYALSDELVEYLAKFWDK